MEGGSRKQRWNNYNNRRPPSGKPPQSSWHPKTVPSWEKDFCRVVGCFSWHTFLQMKEYMHFYENVINWNDSAGEEAFHNAKKRYWAKIKGLQCNVPSPDPDLYIQNIDWNAQIAPDELDNLDSKPESPESGHEPVLIFGESFYADQGFSAVGWGDAEEKPIVSTDNNVKASGWTDNNNNNRDEDDKDAWKVSDGGGEDHRWNSNDWSWQYENEHNNSGEGRTSGGFRNSRVQGYGDRRNQTWRGDKSGYNKGSYNRGRQGNRSGVREQGLDNFSGQRSRMRVGDAWNWEKRAS